MPKTEHPIYKVVARQIIDQIQDSLIRPGELLLSENELARKYAISRLTARRVYNELSELGYAYSLRGKGTYVSRNLPETLHPKQIRISIIFPEPTPIFLNLIAGIESACKEFGYTTIVNFSYDSENEERLIYEMIRSDISGFIITPLRNSSRAVNTYRMLMRIRTPLVMIGKPPLGIFCDYIYTDDISVFYSVYQKFVERRHSGFLLVGDSLGDPKAQEERRYAYDLACRDFFPDKAALYSDFQSPSFADDVYVLIAQNSVTVVFVDNERIAVKIYNHFLKNGIHVPGTVNLVVFTQSRLVKEMNLPFTVIELPEMQIGQRSVHMLNKQILSGDNSFEYKTCSVFNSIVHYNL